MSQSNVVLPDVVGSVNVASVNGCGSSDAPQVFSDAEDAQLTAPRQKQMRAAHGLPRCANPIRWVLVPCAVITTVSLGLSAIFRALRPPPEERAAIASPRTAWSSRSGSQSAAWFRFQRLLAAEAARFSALGDGTSRVVLIGDSITEAWRGTSYGQPVKRAEGVPEALRETIAATWRTLLVLGISGDQTQHVLWRLEHGELSASMRADSGLMFVLLIGTNNLGRGHLPDETHKGIAAIARNLLGRTAGRLLLSALLPRGDGAEQLPKLCPPRCNHRGLPFRSFSPAVARVNELLARTTAQLAADFPGRVNFVDCGGFFEAATPNGTHGGAEVNIDLMPDRLHPNADGHRLFGKCLRSGLLKLESFPREP